MVTLSPTILEPVKLEPRKEPFRLVVMGIGGGGVLAAARLYRSLKVEEFQVLVFALDTDPQHLQRCTMPEDSKLLLGGGRPTQGFPRLGVDAVKWSREKIKDVIRDADFVIVMACLGGGTGTGATLEIVRLAVEQRSQVAAVVVMPLEIEDTDRRENAEWCLSGLHTVVPDSLLVVVPQALIPLDELDATKLNKLLGTNSWDRAIDAADETVDYSLRALIRAVPCGR